MTAATPTPAIPPGGPAADTAAKGMSFQTKDPLVAARADFYGLAKAGPRMVFSYASPQQVKQAKMESMEFRIQQQLAAKGIALDGSAAEGSFTSPYAAMQSPPPPLNLASLQSQQCGESGGIDQFQVSPSAVGTLLATF